MYYMNFIIFKGKFMTDGHFRTSRRAVQLARLAQAICLAGVASRLLFVFENGASREAMRHYISRLEPNMPLLISNETWIGFGIVLALDLFISAWAFLELFGLFGALVRGETMSEGMERRVIRLGIASSLGALLAIFGRTLYSLVAFMTDVPPPHHWGVDLSQTVLFKILWAIMLFLFVMILRELRRVDAENRSFV
jgi:hypothetical protein